MEQLEIANQVTAVFPDRHAVRVAIDQLVQAGFSRDEISVLMTESTYDLELVPDSGSTAVFGAIVASLVRVAAGFATPLVAAGPLVTALAPADRALPERILRQLEQGGILVGVRAVNSRATLAAQILELAGGASPRAA